jgi:UPF0716 protein FxsA
MIALILIALFVLGPLAEIYVLIEAAQAIGAFPVILLCIGTAVLGGVLLRIQGLSALRSASRDMEDGRVPVEAAVDGVFLALAAPMLMLPGFITDAMGFLLLVPAVRHSIARYVLARLRDKVAAGDVHLRIWKL